MSMSLYETRLRGARKRLAEAHALAPDPATQERLSYMINDLITLIDALRPVTASAETLTEP